jgi:hypothetical protein
LYPGDFALTGILYTGNLFVMLNSGTVDSRRLPW